MGYFSIKERVFLYLLSLIFLISFGLFLREANNLITVSIPARGGTFKEGIVGIPRFANPVLATSDVDRDIAALVYSGLMRPGHDGALIPDLAEQYAISADGLTYTFKIKKGATFHDGSKVTSADVAYTVGQIKNPIFKSPRAGAWNNVAVETPDEETVIFRLKSRYLLFLENTTLGILPKKLWKKENDDTFPYSDLNITGIGSGPYRIADIVKNKSGVPTSLTLSSFRSFTLGEPYIKQINLRFFMNDEALLAAYRSGEVEAISGIPAESVSTLSLKNAGIVPLYLPRVFGVFFNQSRVPAFTYKEVRAALDGSLDKETITREVLKEYGKNISGPIPPGSFGYRPASTTIATTTPASRLVGAKALLEQNQWKLVDGVFQKSFAGADKKKSNLVSLTFTIATADTPELKKVAEMIRDTWTSLGAKVELKVYEVGDLNQNVIRARNFDSLFFGEIVGRNPDPYFFWHSSQRLDPGLNIAQYANPAVDKLVESLRESADNSDRLTKLHTLDETIRYDVPASFIYAPQYIYVVNNKIRGMEPLSLTTPDERFSNIHTWYIDTERVWKVFSK